MLGWRIYQHSALLVLRNWYQALRIALVPALIGLVIAIALLGVGFATIDFEQELGATDANTPNIGLALNVFLVSIIGMVLMLWAVVSWHRFVLLEEYPTGWIPQMHGSNMLGYFGRLILLGLVALLAMIPAAALFAIPGLGLVAAPIVFLLLSALIYRLVCILPAAAIGKPITLRESWDATTGQFTAILVLMLVTFVVSIGVQLIVTGVTFVIPLLGGLLSLAASVVLGLINVSVLTTFYGIYIEGRTID